MVPTGIDDKIAKLTILDFIANMLWMKNFRCGLSEPCDDTLTPFIIGSGCALQPVLQQAITWTNGVQLWRLY